MSIERFLKYLVDFVNEVEINGITLKHDGEFTQKVVFHREVYFVPVFEIINPNNIAFTKTAIEVELQSEINNFKKFIPGLENYRTENLYEIEGPEFYIPNYVSKELKNCLKNKTFNRVWTQFGGGEYRVKGYYTGAYEFYFRRDEIEWEVQFHLESITKINPETNEETQLNRVDSIEFFTDIKFEDREFFEDQIWVCLRKHLSENEAFLDFSVMSWYTTPYLD